MRDLLLFSILLCMPLAGQEAEAPDAVFHSDAPLVELHATVTDKDGHLLLDVKREAFQVFENDVAQEIKVFRHEDAPVSLGLIIDNSASMRDKRAKVAAALLALIHASNEGDEAFIVNFNQTASIPQDFTKDPAQLEKALAKIDSNGETAMRDALSLGLQHLNRLAKNDKKVLLVITDGEDNSSVESQERLSRTATQSGVLIYAIGLLSENNERETARAKHDLDALANSTGGEAFYPGELSEVDSIALHVAHDLRNQYTIAYSPSDQRRDGSFRRIRVEVSDPAGAVVKTRTGYYAPGVL